MAVSANCNDRYAESLERELATRSGHRGHPHTRIFWSPRMLKAYPESSGPQRTTAWIDLCDPTEDEIAQAVSLCNLPIPTRAQLEEIESSSRLRVEGSALYLSMPVSAHPEQHESAPKIGRAHV